MPTITDATVVAQTQETSGNGNRKIVQLKSGNIYAITMTGQLKNIIYKSVDNGLTWTVFKEISTSSVTTKAACLETDGIRIFALEFYSNSSLQCSSFAESGTKLQEYVIESTSTTNGDVSLAINEAKTELHAAWASKNATYPDGFNIRYAKGVINADGTVTWGMVEQVTNLNVSGGDVSSPSIIYANSNTYILASFSNGTARSIVCYSKSLTGNSFGALVPWHDKFVYSTTTYNQSSPSAIYVPQSINGLANGRIWVAWQGTDASHSNPYIRYSYSDDLGITWTDGGYIPNTNLSSSTFVSISASTTKSVFLTFQGVETTTPGVTNIYNYKIGDSSISKVTNVTSSVAQSPNAIGEITNATNPLFIYQNGKDSKVGFYGSWAISSISPTQGDRGIITNRQSMLTYAITSDDAVGTVTEKINGVTVGTKNLTSGQNTTISITQAQWDNIKYGKYKDINANRNTITIEAQGNTYTYTFDKEPTSASDIISQAKAVKDSAEVSMPAKKKILSDAINAKGGSTVQTDSLETMASVLKMSSSSKNKSGTSVSSSSTKTFTASNGANASSNYITIDTSFIGFIPNYIAITRTAKNNGVITNWFSFNFFETDSNNYGNSGYASTVYRVPISTNLDIPVNANNVSYSWVAYE